MFDTNLFYQSGIENLDVICFSVDGPTSDINDYIRKGANLDIILKNMRYAQDMGYEVRVNTTVTSLNINHIFQTIQLAQDNGVSEINLNVIILMGNAKNNAYLEVKPCEWLRVYLQILDRAADYNIRIKVPPAFSRLEHLRMHTQRGHRCVALEGSRVYVAPDGTAYPCILFLGSDNGYRDVRTLKSAMGNGSDSYCKFLHSSEPHYLPLCIFYKERLNYSIINETRHIEPVANPLAMEVCLG
jgi:MoaA/NifB/PqqE/SkfB family radical SAM enzyme